MCRAGYCTTPYHTYNTRWPVEKKRFVWQIRWHRLSTAACQTLYIVRCRQHRCVSLSARCRCCLNFLDLVPWFTTFFRCQLNRLLSVLIKKDDIASSVTVRTGTHWRESQIRPGTRSTLSTFDFVALSSLFCRKSTLGGSYDFVEQVSNDNIYPSDVVMDARSA